MGGKSETHSQVLGLVNIAFVTVNLNAVLSLLCSIFLLSYLLL